MRDRRNIKKKRTVVSEMVDEDKTLKYERINCLTGLIRLPLILFLDILPSFLGKLVLTIFSGEEGDTMVVCQNPTTYKALEILYTYPFRRERKEINLFNLFWHIFLRNAKSIRNRLKLTKKELLYLIREVGSRKDKVCLLSLGSGSARAVIETIGRLNGAIPVESILVDTSRSAINFSQELASQNNINGIKWCRGFAQNFEQYLNGSAPDVVEMVGLLDYYTDDQAVELISKVYQNLSPGGWFITCNISLNIEEPFVRKAMGWPMIYRSSERLATIVIKGGFDSKNIKVIKEPLRIHTLIVAKK